MGNAKAYARVSRISLLVVGILIVLYAVSDHPFYGGEPGFGRVQLLITCAGATLAWCALLLPRHAGGMLLLAVSSLTMLAVAELVGETLLASRHRPLYQADDRLIFKFMPARCSVMTHAAENGGATIKHCINSAGFRGKELQPAGKNMRVVVYGDSFIHAYYSAEEETLPVRLARELGSLSTVGIEVINAGVSSYGPDQIAVKLADELAWLGPDLVIVSIYAGNDYGDLLRNKMFRLGAEGELVENHWQLDSLTRTSLELNQRSSILVRAARSALERLRVRGEKGENVLDLGFLLAEAEREYRSFVLERNNTVTNTHVDYYSADVSFTPASPSAVYKIALMRQTLARIRDTASHAGIPLVFLLIPHPYDLSDGSAWGEFDAQQFPDYDGRNQVRFLEDIAERLRVPHVSLFDKFRSRGADVLYLRGGDDHWNGAGQAFAAQILAAYLHTQGLVGNLGAQVHRRTQDSLRQ